MILTLKIATQPFGMTLRVMMMHHHIKFGCIRFSGSEDIFQTKCDTHRQTDGQPDWSIPPPPPLLWYGWGGGIISVTNSSGTCMLYYSQLNAPKLFTTNHECYLLFWYLHATLLVPTCYSSGTYMLLFWYLHATLLVPTCYSSDTYMLLFWYLHATLLVPACSRHSDECSQIVHHQSWWVLPTLLEPTLVFSNFTDFLF